MKKKIVISMVVVALLLVGIMATSVLALNLTLGEKTDVKNDLQTILEIDAVKTVVSKREITAVPVDTNDPSVTVIPVGNADIQDVDVDNIRELVPDTYDESDGRVIQRTRFLLYTNDGKHVMWGYVGNGHFVGTDNLGKRCWGIYGKGVFAGFY
ncbi:hypothetical protein KJN74_04760, partial [Candidatus Bathyarchaeota archaeon]|nr:hypothetical protein [Candidatus Bathyarchaeota archaeon]